MISSVLFLASSLTYMQSCIHALSKADGKTIKNILLLQGNNGDHHFTNTGLAPQLSSKLACRLTISMTPHMKTAIAAALLGIILTFAFAPCEIFPLGLLSMTGLLALWIQSPSAKRAFWSGYCFGLGFFGFGVYWVFISIHVFGDVPIPLAILITSGMIAILSLFPACTGYLLNRNFPLPTTAKLVYAFPAIWVFMEWLRSMFFSGFPWLLLGYSQTNSPLKGYAPILGVYGISLAICIGSGLLLNAFFRYQQKNFKSLCQNLLALVLIFLLGGLFSLIPWTIREGKPLTVSLVQGNIPQTTKWSPDYLQSSVTTYTTLTEALWGKRDIIIWPETALPLPLQNAETLINELDEKARNSHSALILGIPIRTPDDKSYYNSIVTLGADKGVYSKRHLVPFGEYTPFASILANPLQFMDIPVSEMTEGSLNQSPLMLGKIKILPSICYEIAFPLLIRSPDKSINMLLVVTNDAWFGNSSAEPQHLQMAAMRALEFGKPVLFVSNDGITAIINQHGQVEASIPRGQAMVLNGSVQPMYGVTPWLINGMDPVLFIFILFIVLAVIADKKTERVNNQPINENEYKNGRTI